MQHIAGGIGERQRSKPSQVLADAPADKPELLIEEVADHSTIGIIGFEAAAATQRDKADAKKP